MNARKAAPIILLVVVALVLAGFGYRWHQTRTEGQAKIQQVAAEMDQHKSAMLKGYADRLAALEDWATAVAADPKKAKPALALSEAIKQSGELKADTQEEAARFDFVQNQVSEKITQYIQADPGSANMREIQKIEEQINRDRRRYHDLAFDIEALNKQYGLKDVQPVVFQAERTLQQMK